MLLLSAASPHLLMPASSLGMLRWLLRGQLVVCASALPPDFIAALLAHGGAKGVVCRARETALLQTSADDCCAFYAAFYDALLAGKTATDSVRLAEEQCPALRDVFQLCTG